MLLPPFGSGGHLRALASMHQQMGQMQQSAQRLATGKRINRAADDPAGLLAADELRRELSELEARVSGLQAESNRARITETGLAAAQNIVHELRGLVGAVANGWTDEERELLQYQIDQSIDGLGLIGNYLPGVELGKLSELRSEGKVSTPPADLEKAATALDEASSSIAWQRAQLGAYQRTTVEPMLEVLEEGIIVHTENLSRIEDTDYAEETGRFVAARILAQSSVQSLTYFGQQWANALRALTSEAAHRPRFSAIA